VNEKTHLRDVLRAREIERNLYHVDIVAADICCSIAKEH